MKNCKWILLVAIALSYFISPYLPFEWGWENSLLEWLQVLILVFGLILNHHWWQQTKSAGHFDHARFLAWTIPLWLLMIGRELSWGRVFYPNGFDAINGPSFVLLAQLPYGPFVNPLIVVFVMVWFYLGIKYALYKIPYKLLKERRFPVTELVIVVFAFLFAEIGERQLHLQNMEEFNECLAYLGLILVAYCVKVVLQKEANNH